MGKKKKEMSFSVYKRERDEKKKINEASWTGLIVGLTLIVVCGYRALCEVGFRCVVFTAVAAAGAALFILGGFFPWGLIKPLAVVKRVFSVIGKTVMRIILFPIYLLFAATFLMIRPVVGKKYEFTKGKGFAAAKPSYTEYRPAAYQTGRFASVSAINNVVLFLTENGMAILLPVVLLLLLLGIFFFFISTHTVFSFIYTLF